MRINMHSSRSISMRRIRIISELTRISISIDTSQSVSTSVSTRLRMSIRLLTQRHSK